MGFGWLNFRGRHRNDASEAFSRLDFSFHFGVAGPASGPKQAEQAAADAGRAGEAPLCLPGPAFSHDFADGALRVGAAAAPLRIASEGDRGRGSRWGGTGFNVWDGAVVAASWAEASRIARAGESSPVRARLATAASVLELGSGTGLAGLAAAAELGVEVTLTDLPEVVPALQRNADANAEALAANGARASVEALNWLEAKPEALAALRARHAGGVILVADCVWLEELVAPLVRVLTELQLPVAMTYQSRSRRVDELLFGELRERGFAVARVAAASEGLRRAAERIQLLWMEPPAERGARP